MATPRSLDKGTSHRFGTRHRQALVQVQFCQKRGARSNATENFPGMVKLAAEAAVGAFRLILAADQPRHSAHFRWNRNGAALFPGKPTKLHQIGFPLPLDPLAAVPALAVPAALLLQIVRQFMYKDAAGEQIAIEIESVIQVDGRARRGPAIDAAGLPAGLFLEQMMGHQYHIRAVGRRWVTRNCRRRDYQVGDKLSERIGAQAKPPRTLK